MLSTAQQIRAALLTEIQQVPGIGETGYDPELWDKVTRVPGATVVLDTVEKERAPTRSKQALARYIVACTLRGENLQDQFDTLMAAIENAIEDDPSLGGLAMDAWVAGCGPFATSRDIALKTYIRGIVVMVEYRHPRAAA